MVQKSARKRRAGRSRRAPSGSRRFDRGFVLTVAGLVVFVGGMAALTTMFALTSDDGTADSLSELPAFDPGPVHVHGLGINPSDGSLLIATHTGMWRVPEGDSDAYRVGKLFQDTMGFTVAGPDYFLGSGHPDVNEARRKKLPSRLGLIESRDAGETWQPISLLGQADFHVLRFVGERVYGYDSSNDRLLVSRDRGSTWSELARPGPLIDLAANPANTKQLLASTEAGLFRSNSGGRNWTGLTARIGLLAWPDTEAVYLVEANGTVFVSGSAGDAWVRRGNTGGQPAALLGRPGGDLYVALHDGTIKRSTDAGRSWTVRSRP